MTRKFKLAMIAVCGVLFAVALAFGVAACAKGTVTLSFDANGGAFSDGGTVYTVSGAEGEAYEAPPAPALTDRYFGGWSESREGAAVTLPEHIPGENKTYYAVWRTEATVTVTFDANGGAFPDGSPTYTAAGFPGEAIYLPVSPKLAGQIFSGWSASAEGAVVDVRVYPQTETTYYAQWRPETPVERALTLVTGAEGESRETVTVYSGTALSSVLSSRLPAATDGMDFAGWYEGSVPLAEGATMPNRNLTLTAKYYTDYTYTLFLQGTDGNYTEGESGSGTAIYGNPFDAADAVTPPAHYKVDSARSESATARLGKGQHFTIYFGRTTYTVTLVANNFAATPSDPVLLVMLYGAADEAVLPACPFTAAGYRFAGWAESENGAPVRFAGDPLPFKENETDRFFAVWDRGYTDFFGSRDVVFLPAHETGKAYLQRNGAEYAGVWDGESFTFGEGEDALTGKIFEAARRFAYSRPDLDTTFVLYDAHLDAVSSDATLTLDGCLSGTYVYHDGAGKTVEREGTYFAAENGEYFFGFNEITDGDAGFYFTVGERSGAPYFSVKADNEEGYFGQYVFTAPLAHAGYLGADSLHLDGYGNVLFTPDSGESFYSGKYKTSFYSEQFGDRAFLVEMQLEDYEIEGRMRFVAVPDEDFGALVYEDDFAGAYTGTLDGGEATLTLDGYALTSESAVLTAGGDRTVGTYAVRQSAIFGAVLDFYTVREDGVTVDLVRSFRLLTETKPVMRFEPLDENFTEYWRLKYMDNGYGFMDNRLTTPVVVLYDTPYGSGLSRGVVARVYAVVEGELSMISEGYVTKEQIESSESYFYSYHFLNAASGMQEDLFYREFTFLVNDVSATNSYCIYEADGEKLYTLFYEKEGGGRLYYYSDTEVSPSARFGSLYVTGTGEVVYGGMDILPLNFRGTFFTFEANGADTFYYFYCESFASRLFEVVPDRPAEYILVNRYGSTQYAYVTYTTDGRGNARYAAERDENGMPLAWVEGTYARTGMTYAGEPIYTFTDGDGNAVQYIFYHIVVEDLVGGWSEFDYYHLLDEETEGIYTGEGSALLQLDGFSHYATYNGPRGNFDGTYVFDPMSANTVLFTSGEEDEEARVRLSFVLSPDGRTFADTTQDFVFTSETWKLCDTNYESLAGYEDAEIAFSANGTFVMRENTSRLAGGTFSLVDATRHIYALEIDFGTRQESWQVQLVHSYANYLCVRFDDARAGLYTAPDFSQLDLDGYGFGTYTDAYGFSYEGYYTVLTDAYLVFFLDDSNAFFAVYDAAEKTFAYPDHSQYVSTYYSETFASVVFAPEGLYLDGSLYGFYVAEGGNLRVFEYDYFTDTFTEHSMPLPGGATYDYDGVTYYRWTEEAYAFSGTIDFSGVGMPEKNLSATLTFTPTGEPVFETAATLSYTDSTGAHTLAATVVVLMDTEITVRIYDEYGFLYDAEVSNLPDGKTFTLYGGFVERVYFGDIVESGNMIDYGYYGFGSLAVSESKWSFAFDATDSLGQHIFSSDQETFPAEYFEGEMHDVYGRMYEIRKKGTDGFDYVLQFMLVDSALSPVEPSEDGESGLLLVYAAYRTNSFEATDGKNELRVDTMYYVYANVFDFTVGTNDVLLYVKENGAYRRVAYSESASRFSEDGDWAVLTASDGGAAVTWLLEYTLAGDGAVTAVTVTQGQYAEQLSADEKYIADFFYVWEDDLFEVVRLFGFGYIDGDMAYLYHADYARGENGRWTAVTGDGVYTLVFTEQNGVVTYTAGVGGTGEDLVYRDANGEGTITLKADEETVAINIPSVLEHAEAAYSDLVQLTVFDRLGVLWALDVEADGGTYTVRFFLGGTDGDLTFTLYSVALRKQFRDELNSLDIYLVENVFANDPRFAFRRGEIIGADLYEDTAEGSGYLEALLWNATPDDRFVFYTYLDPDLGLLFGFRMTLRRGADGLVEDIDFAQVGILYDRDWLTSANMPFSAMVEDYEFVDGQNMGVTKYTFYYYGAADANGDPLIITVDNVESRRQVATFGYPPTPIYLVRGRAEDGAFYDVEYVSGATVSFEGGSMSSSVLYSVDRVALLEAEADGVTYSVDVTQAYHVHTEYLLTPNQGDLAFISIAADGAELQPVSGGITYDAKTHTVIFRTAEHTYTVTLTVDGAGWFVGAAVTVS